MQTFDQALLHHVQGGRVAMEDAVAAASSPHDFKLLVAGEGRTATSMSDLPGDRQHEEPAPTAGPPRAAPPHAAPAMPAHEAPVPHAAPEPAHAASHGSGNGRASAPPPGFLS
jgi:twitching motility protein PilT